MEFSENLTNLAGGQFWDLCLYTNSRIEPFSRHFHLAILLRAEAFTIQLDFRTRWTCEPICPMGPYNFTLQLYIHYAVVHVLSPRTNLRSSKLAARIDQDSKIVRASLTRRSALLGRHRPGFVTLPPSVFHLKGFRQSVPNHWPA